MSKKVLLLLSIPFIFAGSAIAAERQTIEQFDKSLKYQNGKIE
jgi:hypothetical protein